MLICGFNVDLLSTGARSMRFIIRAYIYACERAIGARARDAQRVCINALARRGVHAARATYSYYRIANSDANYL